MPDTPAYADFTGKRSAHYVAAPHTATIVNLAIRLGRPLLVEGEYCADCSTPEAVARLNQFRDALIEVHDPVTGATGWGNCQTWTHGE